MGASEVEEDDAEDILGQPEDVNISSLSILTSQLQKTLTNARPRDISLLPDDGPMQPGLKKEFHFPKTHGRRFTLEWFKKFPWLEYSVCEDKVYCFTCRHFSMVAKNTSRPFVTEGFCQWKKCTGESQQNNRLLKHKNSQLPVDSTTGKAYMESKLANQTVTSLLNEGHNKLVERNRNYLKIIADTLRLTAVQNIAQQGHRESNTDDDNNNKGNFLEILSFMKNYSEILKDRLESGPQNAKYTHHTLQDAILEILSDIILDVTKEIQEAEYFALLVDETINLSKQEQFTFVLRYVFEYEVHEEFLGFRNAKELTAESLSDAIQDETKQIGVNINNLVAQGYDGAAVMSGKCSGVQERIKTVVPQALYVHCFAHRPNLVIVQAVKSVVPVADFFAALQMCYNLGLSSARRQCYK
ncbi:zinc finger MYM-type protein 1-like [Dendronephthya gigantea]|uniref:zinc finger MYM-type protein 1-like n=1 Tax=Dendronephthya gigantea TaxID=151771 RepID=UPI00106B4B7A|nr:zinc finger MYM-type protein 1-like [Dendronephthya gigantea]